ncbi:MAG: thiamine phosphate synthase, partial [Candidatus Methylomirabilales bacterium]
AGPLDELLPRVLEAGVDLVQLRDKDMEARSLLRYAEVVRRRTEEFGALFIVNDRVDLACAAGADGVHLGQEDLSAAAARQMIGAGLIGLSTHTEEQIRAAAASEADYLSVGPVHLTPTKPGRPAVGCALVRFAAAHARLPFFAIGGIDSATAPAVAEAGARRVAVVRAIVDAGDPAAAARQIRRALEPACEHQDPEAVPRELFEGNIVSKQKIRK